MKIRKQLVNPRIPQPIEGILPLVDGTSIEEENSDADEDQVVLDEDSELPQEVHALEDDSERKRGHPDDLPMQMNKFVKGIRRQ